MPPPEPPLAYGFEGDALPALAAGLPAAFALPPGWAGQVPAALLEPGTDRLRLVGVLGAGQGLLVLLPRYLRHRPAAAWAAPATGHAAEAARVLAVLHRYAARAAPSLPEAAPQAAAPDCFGGEPALALALLEDYQQRGYWHEPQRELTTAPGARPHWPRTVARAQPLLTPEGSALYAQPLGYRTPPGAAAPVLEQLHRWAVAHCLRRYAAVLPGLHAVGHDPADTPADLREIGEPAYLAQVLEAARRRTFADGPLRTLALLADLLAAHYPASGRPAAAPLWGTTAFYQVWERACQTAFADRRARLPLPLPVATWHPLAPAPGTPPVYRNPGNRLIPDVVWFDEDTLLLADAKYYDVAFGAGGTVAHGPGMPDLTKQLLYAQALLPGLQAAGLARRHLRNVWVLPTARLPAATPETAAHWHWGHVRANIPGWEGRQVGIWFVPPALVLDAYLAEAPLAWQPGSEMI